jgi:hypothetical protein
MANFPCDVVKSALIACVADSRTHTYPSGNVLIMCEALADLLRDLFTAVLTACAFSIHLCHFKSVTHRGCAIGRQLWISESKKNLSVKSGVVKCEM